MFGGWHVLFSFNRNIRLYLMAWGLLAFGYLGVQGVLLNLYLLRLGYDAEFIGLLTASGQVVWALMALPAGALGQRIGLRTSLILSYLIVGISMALLLLVELLPPQMWSAWLFGCWIALWIGAALSTVNSIPYLVTITRESERNYAFSAQAALVAGLTFVGSMVAGFLPGQLAGWLGASLTDPAPFRDALLLAPVVYLLGALAFTLSNPVKAEQRAAQRSTSRPPLALFWMVGLVSFLGAAADGGVRAFFNVYLDTQLAIPTFQIGAIMGLGQFVPIFVALLTPAILARWGATRTIALALFVMGMVIMPMAMIPLWQVAAVCFMGVLCMISLREPARKLFSQEIVPPQWGTTSSAINTIGVALGWAIMAGVGGYLIPVTGFHGLFLIAGVLALGASCILLGYLRTQAVNTDANVEMAAAGSGD